MLRALSLVAVASAVSLGVPDGEPTFVDMNDVDWESCHIDQIKGQSGMMKVAMEENDVFIDHTAYLYRCDSQTNPLYVRLSGDEGTSTLLKFSWPDVLDETYIFATKEDDKEDIGYGFRALVASRNKKRFHFRRFLFKDLRWFNKFVGSVSQLTNNVPVNYRKADFFKAPRYLVTREGDVAAAAPAAAAVAAPAAADNAGDDEDARENIE